jgi:hypothetical protein
MKFEELFNLTKNLWLEVIGHAEIKNIELVEFQDFYEGNIENKALLTGSRLIVQLDWIIYSTVCKILKVATVARLDELRADFIKKSFHDLLLTVGLSQIKGENSDDGSFDLVELKAYLKENNLT